MVGWLGGWFANSEPNSEPNSEVNSEPNSEVNSEPNSEVNSELPSEQASLAIAPPPVHTHTRTNEDRLQCVRQDEQDLVVPSDDKYVVRMAWAPKAAETTDKDIYVSLKTIAITQMNAQVEFTRLGNGNINFKVFGEGKLDDYNGVAEIEMVINGLDIKCREWKCGLAVMALPEIQGSKCKLKMKMEGELSVEKSLEGDLIVLKDVVSTQTEKQPFQFEIPNNQALQYFLSKWMGIDQMIKDGVMDAVKLAIPKSFVAALFYMSEEDLHFNIPLVVTANMSPSDSELNVIVDFNPKKEKILTVKPSQLFRVYAKDIDFTALAKAKVDEFLKNPDFQRMWSDNRQKFIATLAKYGFKDMPALANAHNIEDLRPDLEKTARTTGDWLQSAIQPFIKDKSEESLLKENSVFEGLSVTMDAKMRKEKRSPGNDNPRLKASLKSTNPSIGQLMILPQNMIDSILPPLLVPPLEGKQSSLEGSFKLSGNELTVPSVKIHEITVFQNGTAPAGEGGEGEEGRQDLVVPEPADHFGYEITGQAEDMTVRVPESWVQDVSLSGKKTKMEVTSSGSWIITVDQEGWVVEGTPSFLDIPVAFSGGPHRTHDKTNLNGTLPPEVSRVTEEQDIINLETLAPVIEVRSSVEILGANGKLEVNFAGKVKNSFNIRQLLAGFLAKRDKYGDLGYAFANGTFTRHDEPVDKTKGTTVVAVVNCGYLRIYTQLALDGVTPKYPYTQLDMTANGQLVLDLAKYTSLDIRREDNCIRISSDYRKAGKQPVKELKLCGHKEDVEKLKEAINLQIARFQFDPSKTKDWKFGTHLVDDDQDEPFAMALGRESEDLSRILSDAGFTQKPQ